jgi:hypothetical protein
MVSTSRRYKSRFNENKDKFVVSMKIIANKNAYSAPLR